MLTQDTRGRVEAAKDIVRAFSDDDLVLIKRQAEREMVTHIEAVAAACGRNIPEATTITELHQRRIRGLPIGMQV